MPVLSRLSGLSRYVNPRILRLARKQPPLAVLHHTGRRTGRSYDTPVQAYRTGTGFVVGLVYGRNSAWALNILDAGHAEMTRHRRRYALTNPRRQGVEARAELPTPVALATRALGVVDYVAFDAAPLDEADAPGA